jgi:NADPH-dependent glutamate synthase beta subunit-like oxidoreductase
VAIVGGATAGAEVASRLADRGIQTVVFEQNARPFGKIEDGLPRWHEALRRKEYETIRKKLSLPLVEFVPNTRIGEDIPFEELVEDWNFSSVILANGAWWDRPLPMEGAEAYINKGLVYQNSFVIAFNHDLDSTWSGEKPEIIDGSIVIGGGLASIDVAKIITLTCTQRELAKRGIDVELNTLEVKGIPKILAAHDLCWEELGLAGSTIYYRRRVEDMPLVDIPDGADEERVAKTKKSRQTILDKATRKFMFNIEPLSAPDELIIEDGELVGIRFKRCTPTENPGPGSHRPSYHLAK